MKILHLVATYLPAYRYGGPIKSVHELNKALVKSGMEVVVYTTNIDGEKDLDVPLDEPVYIDGVKIFYFKAGFFRFWFYSRALHQALKRNTKDFDLIHITSVFLSVSTLGSYYAKKYHKPCLISPRGSLMAETLRKKSFKKKFYISLIEKRNLKSAAIHFTTDQERKEYINNNLPLNKAFVIPNIFSADEFKEKVEKGYFRGKYRIAPQKKIILFLGRISWKKGLDTLIPAFSLILKKEPEALLVICGGDDEGYGRKVKDLIEKYQLGNKVILTGSVQGKDKIGAFLDSNVFALPSYSENFGLTPLEALHFGLPIVITENVGIAPQIKKAGAGLVIKKDEEELSGAILELLNNKTLAKKLTENGGKLLESEFSASKIAERFRQVYTELINQNKNS